MAVVLIEHDALAAAVTEGLLPAERYCVDFKGSLYPSDPANPERRAGAKARRKAHAELAQYAASMALRGGYVIYGVAENDDGWDSPRPGWRWRPA